jgi:hypothetical protein
MQNNLSSPASKAACGTNKFKKILLASRSKNVLAGLPQAFDWYRKLWENAPASDEQNTGEGADLETTVRQRIQPPVTRGYR